MYANRGCSNGCGCRRPIPYCGCCWSGSGGGATGASFADVRTGIRAQVQHLRAYADSSVTTASLANAVVDPRFTYVRKGAAPVVEYLGIQENPNRTGWAAAKNYGYDLVSMMKAYF